MIYLQKTWAVINDESIKYPISYGILLEDIYSKKKYVWLDEEPTTKNMELNSEKFAEYIKRNDFDCWKIKKRLFKDKEYLEWDNHWDERATWDLDKIEKVTIKFEWTEQNMTIGKAEDVLDVEEYAKMLKGLGLKSYK